MEKIKYTMALENFLADERFGEGTIETIINNAKIGLLQKLYFDKLKGKEDDFIIQFKNEYWDYNRINYVLDNDLRVTNGLYKHPYPTSEQVFIDRAEAYKLISDKKPFDIVLLLKTKEELNCETELKERFPSFFIPQKIEKE